LRALDATGPLRPVLQQEQRLAPEVGARIARHGKHVDIRCRDAAHLQAGSDRVVRKTRHVLDPSEPLLFDGRDKLSVADQRRRDVAVIRVEAEYVHGVSDTMRLRHRLGRGRIRGVRQQGVQPAGGNGPL
jgi:hypothetical protein